jgi:hypothetical protein
MASNSLVNDMLQEKLKTVEEDLRCAIAYQKEVYELAKRKTFELMMGTLDSTYSLVQHFKYQATIASTLREMEMTYFHYFNKAWNFVAPEEPIQKKRGRKPKSMSI